VFDLILDRSVRKPKSEKIRIALEQFKVHPGGACYVGDLAHDILESQEAGIAVAAVGYGYHPSWYLRRFNPDHILETENDFAAFVGKSCRTESVYHGYGNTMKNESLAINSWENEGGAHA
jgi:phosphoglycolate phosphatase-like HAD superfamily hydrolase